MKLTDKDIEQIKRQGIEPAEIERQYQLLINGAVYPYLISAATTDNGILVPTESRKNELINIFEEKKVKYDTCRFIPASGAATRMFAFLEEWLKTGVENDSVSRFFNEFDKFPFSNVMDDSIRSESKKMIDFLLSESGLKYNLLPKGLVAFHKKGERVFTAIESHLGESAHYALNRKNEACTHFTIGKEFEGKLIATIDAYLKMNDESHLIAFSYQKPETDTIAIDEKGEMLRNDDGEILFRPGGHGSLLSNLNSLNEDIIFIRNIDNVVAPWCNEEYVSVHKMMGGMMIELLESIYSIQNKISTGEKVSSDDIHFLKNNFSFDENNDIGEFVFRPVRICGMVKNEGEPGGGPFWVEENGVHSLQIIESSQVNKGDESQMEIFRSASHFNPVDICCVIKDFRGEKYDLNEFSNDRFSFISEKIVNGKKAKILEHPGLWNGSMHNWLTLFAEIPISVFNPVKTVNDLLRPAHQK